jgi:hypothetical protein
MTPAETSSNVKPPRGKNLLKRFANVNSKITKPTSVIDKPIALKNQESRKHIHRYDLRLGIKECKSEDDEQRVFQGLLEEFFDTMLSADQSIIIPPYYELDRTNICFSDISKTFKVSEVNPFQN